MNGDKDRATLRALGLLLRPDDVTCELTPSSEFQEALAAWRGLADDHRRAFIDMVLACCDDDDAKRFAARLLEAAAR